MIATSRNRRQRVDCFSCNFNAQESLGLASTEYDVRHGFLGSAHAHHRRCDPDCRNKSLWGSESDVPNEHAKLYDSCGLHVFGDVHQPTLYAACVCSVETKHWLGEENDLRRLEQHRPLALQREEVISHLLCNSARKFL